MKQIFVDLTSFLPTLIRWLVLAASTVLVVFMAGVALKLLWSRNDDSSILIRPFVVVDPSGNLKNAETGFAQILLTQMVKLQRDVLSAQSLLKQADSGEILRDDLHEKSNRLPSDRRTQPELLDPALKLHAQDQEKVEVKLQGVDVVGLFSWIKAQLVHEKKGLALTAHIASDGIVTIAGDVSDFGIKDEETVYFNSKAGQSPVAALDDLALQLFQLRETAADARMRDLPLDEYRVLIEKLVDTERTANGYGSEIERKYHYRLLSEYYVSEFGKHPDWYSLVLLAAEMSRRGGDFVSAKKYFQQILDNDSGPSPQIKQSRLQLINDRLASVTAPATAEIRSNEPVRSSIALIRPVLNENEPSAIEHLKEGFAALQASQGSDSFDRIAGLYGVPGWYSWHNSTNSRSSQSQNIFLAWNRAFLYYFERAAQDKVKDFKLICWDWTKGGIPSSFSTAMLADGHPNPLASSFINLPAAIPPIARKTERAPLNLEDLPTSGAVNQVLAKKRWDDFALALENMSNMVHVLVGGDMASVATSAYDPLFYAHRCNIDRIWAMWQEKKQAFDGQDAMDPKLLDVQLPPFALRVRDVLDTTKLGYKYQ